MRMENLLDRKTATRRRDEGATVARRTDPPGLVGDLGTSFDARTGIIHIVGSGLWSAATAERNFLDMQAAAATARQQMPNLRVLVDIRAAAVQTPEATARMQGHIESLWGSTDRIAVVVGSILAKMQVDRVTDSQTHRIFATIADAKAWLAAA